MATSKDSNKDPAGKPSSRSGGSRRADSSPTPPPRPGQRRARAAKPAKPATKAAARVTAAKPPAAARAPVRKTAAAAQATPKKAPAKAAAKPAPKAAAKPIARPTPRAAAKPAARPTPRTAAKAAPTKAKAAAKPARKAAANVAPKAAGKAAPRAARKPAAKPARKAAARAAAKPAPKAAKAAPKAARKPAAKPAPSTGRGRAAGARRVSRASAAPPEAAGALAAAAERDAEVLAAAPAAAVYEEPVEPTVEEAAEIERRRRRRSLRGAVAAFLVAMLVGIILVVASLTVPVPGSGGRTFSGLAGNPALPSSAGWTTWVIIGAIVLAVLMVGLAIATSEKKGWRWVLDTRVVGLIVALVLVAVGLTLLFPPGAPFDLSEIPGLAGNSLQGTLAQPEDGYPRLKVSRVAIDLLLVKGDGKTPPVKYEAYTFPNADHLLAAGNDGNGNSYVYAHARTGMFWRLHDTHIGDTVEVDYGSGKIYRYRISEIHPSVYWKDLSWLQPTADDRLTLQTCNGWKDDDPRFIVVARRIQNQTALSPGQ